MQPLLTSKRYDDPLNGLTVMRGTYIKRIMTITGENLLPSNLSIYFKRRSSQTQADLKLSVGSGLTYLPGSSSRLLSVQIELTPQQTASLQLTKSLTLLYTIQLEIMPGQTQTLGSGSLNIVLSGIEEYPKIFTLFTGEWADTETWNVSFVNSSAFAGSWADGETWSGAIVASEKLEGSWADGENWSGAIANVVPIELNGSWTDGETWLGAIAAIPGIVGNWTDTETFSGTLESVLGSGFSGSWVSGETWIGAIAASGIFSGSWVTGETWAGEINQITGTNLSGAWIDSEEWSGSLNASSGFEGSWADTDGWSGSLVARDNYSMLRIMPLGDSLTSGDVTATVLEPNGYRLPLWNNFKEIRAIDLVGTLKHGGNFLDRDHAGYDGFTTVQIDGIVNANLNTHDPDLVILMAGTNDSNNSANNAAVYRANLVTLMNKIKVYDTQIPIVLMTLIPAKNNTTRNDRINTYNTEIRNLVSTDTTGYLFLADVNGIVNTNNYADDLHPLDSEYMVIANRLFEVIQTISSDRFGRVRKRTNDIVLSGSWATEETWSGAIAASGVFDGSWADGETWSGLLEAEVMSTSFPGSWVDEEIYSGQIIEETRFTGSWVDSETWSGAIAEDTSIEPELTTWQSNVTANGGAYDATTSNALNTLIKAWKANGTWDLMLQFNPICGEDWKAGQVKVKFPVSTSSLETLNNHSASTYTKAGGFQGVKSTASGTVRYLKTDFDPFVQGCTPVDFGMHYATTQAKSAGTSSVWIMGNRNSEPDFTNGTNTVIYESGGNEVRGIINQSSTNGTGAEARYTTAITTGLISVQFAAGETVPTDNRSRLFLNGTLVATALTDPGENITFRTGEIYVQSRNLMYNAAIQQSTNRNCIGYMLTKRIKDFSKLVTPWNTFRAAIGR